MRIDLTAHLTENLRRVRERMAAACARAGRAASSVRLVAVTKYAELEWVRVLLQLGLRDLGESRPRQLLARAAELNGDVRWHLIGHLQRNKVAPLLPRAALIHSVDSFRLLERIDRLAAEAALQPRVLLEVNVSGEASKNGFVAAELLDHGSQLVSYRHVQIAGLMTMAPLVDDPELARPSFRGLRELRDRLVAQTDGCLSLSELSMGMSGDLEIGIEEGATLVRVGGRLFDGLETSPSVSHESNHA